MMSEVGGLTDALRPVAATSASTAFTGLTSVAEHILYNLDYTDAQVICYPDTRGTLTMLLANGPAVGLPFVFANGVPGAQQGRFLHYFDEVWQCFQRKPVLSTGPTVVRGPMYQDGEERDRMGLCLLPSPEYPKLEDLSAEFAPLVETWPLASLVRLSVTFPPAPFVSQAIH